MDNNEFKEILENLLHDVNGQVSIIRMKESMLKKITPVLKEGYLKAYEGGLTQEEVSKDLLCNIDDLINFDEQIIKIQNQVREAIKSVKK